MTVEPCPECGTTLPASSECWSRLHELLEIESRVLPGLGPAVGKRAHFFAVATYQLQHPSRLTRESVDWLRTGVREMLEPTGTTTDRLRRRAGDFAKGSRRVSSAAPEGDRSHIDPRWPTAWSITARDVASQPDSAYPEAVERWAAAALADVDAATLS
ncbi:DUF5946 family protein [Agrococcus sp. ARC_14]|uniref:DUF5946 family protein n=1 Tax=Agrococcus sp. ARC_14 TaxID=2919927 RepID=UPI001F06225B|nr:DUF5946 family protein [Agrococcus sp. ARC_14]